MCEVGIRLPYEQSAQVIGAFLGLAVSGRQVEHIVDRHGQRAVARREQELARAWAAPSPIGQQPPGPQVLYVEGDGAWVNDREGVRMEGKVGVVHQGPQQVGRKRMRLRSAVYVTSFQSGERLGEELYLEADRQGLEQAQQVVFISDGAHWLREVYQTHFYDAVFVLDWFHLQRELKRALRGVAAELGEDYQAAVRMTLRDLLWFGEVDLALERLARLRGRLATADARDAILRFKGYVLNNRPGIHYADLCDQGLYVGSGPIEKAADLIIDRRCELRGMSWYRDTADGVCNLRALRFNPPERWDAFWGT